MKLLIFLLLSASTTLSAQSADQFFKAIGASDYASISSQLSDDIELCIKDVTDILSKEEALNSIKKFLGSHKPSKITPMHGGSSAKNNSKYKVAKLETSSGVFRVFVYMEGGKKIQEVRFDKF